MTRRRNSEAARSNIIKAARSAFGGNGFANTSTVAIAREAEVSEGLIFHHFGNKHGVLEAVVNDDLNRVLASFEPVAGRERESEELVSTTLEHVETDSVILRVWIEGQTQAVSTIQRAWTAALIPAIESRLRRQESAGVELRDSPGVIAVLQVALVASALEHAITHKKNWPRKQAITTTAAAMDAVATYRIAPVNSADASTKQALD